MRFFTTVLWVSPSAGKVGHPGRAAGVPLPPQSSVSTGLMWRGADGPGPCCHATPASPLGDSPSHEHQPQPWPSCAHCHCLHLISPVGCNMCLLCYSAGAGRTGTFCALSTVLERVKAEGILDVFQTVKSLRLQRPHMVQTLVCCPHHHPSTALLCQGHLKGEALPGAHRFPRCPR